jgi:hypothetical protein
MRLSRLLAASLALAFAAGCGGGGPKLIVVKGKLTNNGKSILTDRKSGVTMVFVPTGDNQANTYPAGFESQDDTFQVWGSNLKGIPAGRYKVTITIMPAMNEKPVERFNQLYGESDKTPVEVDVSGPDLDIDLAKFTK